MTEDAYQKRRTEDLENKLAEYKGLLQRLLKDKDLEGEIDIDDLASGTAFDKFKG